MFEFTEQAKRNPRRILIDGTWVSIGTEIVIERKPPKQNEIVPVATQEQLEKLYNSGFYSHLIIKKKKYVKAVEPTESNTGDQQ